MRSVTLDPGASSDFTGGIIIQWPTGVELTVQAAGIACRHPSAEGLFLPLPVVDFPHVGCWGVFSSDERLALHGALEKLGLVLDPDRMSEAMEAWIPVIVVKGPYSNDEYDRLYAFIGSPGWLIYENCD